MNAHPPIIRPFQAADLDGYLNLLERAEHFYHAEDPLLLTALKAFVRKSADPVENNLWVIMDGGGISGACRLLLETAIGRAVLRLFLPAQVLKGDAAEGLIHAALGRAGEFDATVVHVDLPLADRAARDLFEKLNFKPVRHYSNMTLDLASTSLNEARVAGLNHGPLQPGREEDFTRLQNRVFDGSWGFCPNTVDQIMDRLNAPGYGRDGVIITYANGELAGYCWKMTRDQADTGRTPGSRRIHMMGLLPEYRGRGWAGYVLASGLRRLADQGVQTVELTVDNSNAPARRLYERAGFRHKNTLIWYEKVLRRTP